MSSRIVAKAYGGPEVLETVDESLPAPGPGEVLIDVRAIGVNPYDWKSYSGMLGDDPANLPISLGTEASGVVAAVGEGAEGPMGPLTVGDEVCMYGGFLGSYATQLLLPGSSVLPKPEALTFEQAAGLLMAGCVGAHMVDATGVQAGETVLIHGAAGGVGQIATQVAVARGARVIGTAFADQHELVRGLGAEPVEPGDGLTDRVTHTAGPGGVQAVLDGVGSDEALETSLALVSTPDRIVTLVNPAWMEHGIRMLGAGPNDAAERNALRPEIVRLAGEGKLQVQVDRTFPFAQTSAAHQYLMEGHARGKVILVP